MNTLADWFKKQVLLARADAHARMIADTHRRVEAKRKHERELEYRLAGKAAEWLFAADHTASKH